MDDTLFGTLTIFMFVDYPTTDPDRSPKYGRRTLYKAYGVSQENAQKQTTSFIHQNRDRLNGQCVFAKWHPDPIELNT